MKMGLKGTTLILAEVDNTQFTIIKLWRKMKWNANTQQLTGIADLELLDKLAGLVKLPPRVEARRRQMQAVTDAVDWERMNEHPAPFFRYPVKLPLYAHQVRGANMCLLTFGRKALQRARAELDAMNARYNDPCTECYYDLPPEPECQIDLSDIWLHDAPGIDRLDEK